MLMRSPRRLGLLSLAVLAILVLFYNQLPWGPDAVYKQIPLSQSEDAQSTAPAVVDDEKTDGDLPPWTPGFAGPPTPTSAATTPVSTSALPPPAPTNWKQYMQEILQWNRPTHPHWPPFGDYIGKGYDPNRWEEFEMDHRVYDNGFHKLEESVQSSPRVYRPYPDYNSPQWKKHWKGTYVACDGARGKKLNVSEDDQVRAYQSVPKGFPQVFTGGYDVVGLDNSICFDSYSRYGAYGFGDDEDASNITGWKAPETIPEWDDVKWGDLQNECLELNQDRYRPEARGPTKMKSGVKLPTSTDTYLNYSAKGTKYHSRTAVLIRAWTGYNYQENDITAIRAMVTELSLQSGGEYQVFLYVHVKDKSKPIFDDPQVYDEVLRANVPRELRDIAILWSEAIFPDWYPDVTDWQVYWHQFMCLQWFSLNHPEFDYVWNWETDARYTGQHYHFLEKISEFADKQPRKLLWERNKRYYLPAVHGSYASFVEDTQAAVLNSSKHSLIPAPVWGPRPWARAEPPQKPLGPKPPTSFEEDNFKWGVGEPADFVTLLPMWDPRNTSWSYKDKIWNYLPGVHPIFNSSQPADDAFTHPDFVGIERRVYINTVVRFSKRMLLAMHNENLVGRSMQAEMWPSSVALQHGLKAVYAPHPIFSDRYWPAHYADAIFNAQSTIDPFTGASEEAIQGAWTEQADSPYNHDREYNFQGFSWYYASMFPRVLYRRWLGWKVKIQEWAQDEQIVSHPQEDVSKRMCMPGMLLHPVKRMGKDKLQP